MKKYKAFIYDIDNTLLNTLKMNMIPLLQIIEEELDEVWTYDQVLKYASYPGLKVIEELGVEDIEVTYKRWVKYVNNYEEGATVFDDVDKVLEHVNQMGTRQAIVSAKTNEQYQIDCVGNGLDKYMEVVILADDTLNHKPDPEPLDLCISRLGLMKDEVVYIGDTYDDYQASKNCGIDFAFATWGSVETQAFDATYVLNEPLDILSLLIV
ncbi:HAD family hydrolase [Erysipelothrix urinaevulpis]|uniref:HAD family hydrolase n=1 Tax=Erysipelothrix urinaevulpis TaxID=2683717 RepID=UPI0013577DB2|nr:HAD-IA family hydrolase [Erysipelothrix urinaevulpis]